MDKLFFVLSVMGILYFLIKKRHPDLYTVAFFSALIYFSPGFFGYVVYPGRMPRQIHDQVYLVFTFVIFSITFAALLKDLTRRSSNVVPYKIIGTEYYETCLTTVAIILMIYQIAKVNRLLLAPKNIMMPLLGVSFILLRHSAGLAFLTSVVGGKRRVSRFAFIPIVFTFVIGFRGPIAFTGLAFILLRFRRFPANPLIRYTWYTIPVGLFGYLMVMGKIFYGAFKNSGLGTAMVRLFDPEFIAIAFSSLEPFGVQTILNEIIITNFRIGFGHLKGLIYQILVVPSLFGGSSQAFNTIFQSELFPGVSYGMAYNIWGEALASGGYPFLLVVIICYVLGLSMFDRLQESGNTIIRAWAAYAGIYWGFFIHRSSIATQLTAQRHLVYVVIIGLVASLCMAVLGKIGQKGNAVKL